jgi:hypothetical protein
MAHLEDIRANKKSAKDMYEVYLSTSNVMDKKIDHIQDKINELKLDIESCANDDDNLKDITLDLEEELAKSYKTLENVKNDSKLCSLHHMLVENVAKYITGALECGDDDISLFYSFLVKELDISESTLANKRKSDKVTRDKVKELTLSVPYKIVSTARYAIDGAGNHTDVTSKNIFCIRVSRISDPPPGELFAPNVKDGNYSEGKKGKKGSEKGLKGFKGGKSKGFKDNRSMISRSVFGTA